MHRHFFEILSKITITFKFIVRVELILFISHFVIGIYINHNVNIVELHLSKYKYYYNCSYTCTNTLEFLVQKILWFHLFLLFNIIY